MKYEWDVSKAKRNWLKHGVRFADAVTALSDSSALTVEDHFSIEEMRFITVGMDAHLNLLVVVYTHHREAVRIISARKADKNEMKAYEKGIRL